jgi:hypothetical protein
MIRLTNAGTFYAHKPYTRSYSSEFISDCPASGHTIESFHVKRKEGQADASAPITSVTDTNTTAEVDHAAERGGVS